MALHLGRLVQSILLVVMVLLLGEMLRWLLQMMLPGLRGVIALIRILGEVMLLLLMNVGDVVRLLGLGLILLLQKLGVGAMKIVVEHLHLWRCRSLNRGILHFDLGVILVWELIIHHYLRFCTSFI